MSGPTRGPVQRPGEDRDMTEIFQRLGDLERYPPGRWIYVGDYPGDPGTTPDSPPFVGANANAGGGARRLRFRRNSDWSLDIEGVILPDASGSAPNVVTILNELYRPSETVEAPGVGGDWTLTSDGELIFTEDGGGCDACAEIAAHIADTEDAHMASAIGYLGSSDLPRDNVQDAIDYLLNLIDTGGGGVVYGTPAIVLGTAAAAGSIAEAIRRDSTIVAFDATVPTTQAFGDAATTGTAAVAARRDHKHAMPANPFSGAAAGGSLSGTYPNPSIAAGAVGPTELASTAVAAASYGDATHVGAFTVDADGRLTAAASVAITGGSPSGSAGGSLSGTYPNPGIATGAVGAAELASTAVSPATYGDSSHVGQFTVDADGRITGASSIAIPGVGSGGSVKLYDFTITGSDKASIDTNVDGTTVANFAGYDILDVFMLLRTDLVGAVDVVDINVNNDTSSIYDRQRVQGNNATASSGAFVADSAWVIAVHGSGGTSGYPSPVVLTIPGYAATVFNKVGTVQSGVIDGTAANEFAVETRVGWRNTAAITRIKVACESTAKLKVGSRLMVYGR